MIDAIINECELKYQDIFNIHMFKSFVTKNFGMETAKIMNYINRV